MYRQKFKWYSGENIPFPGFMEILPTPFPTLDDMLVNKEQQLSSSKLQQQQSKKEDKTLHRLKNLQSAPLIFISSLLMCRTPASRPLNLGKLIACY